MLTAGADVRGGCWSMAEDEWTWLDHLWKCRPTGSPDTGKHNLYSLLL